MTLSILSSVGAGPAGCAFGGLGWLRSMLSTQRCDGGTDRLPVRLGVVAGAGQHLLQ